MGTDPRAKLFYGFLVPQSEDEGENTTDYFNGHYDLDDTYGCDHGILGCDDHLIEFVCAKESLNVVEWDETKVIELFEAKPEWGKNLRQYCEKLGVPYQKPKWILGCLYF